MEIKWKKTLLISLGIFVLIIGGIITYAKMTDQSFLELLPSTLNGLVLGAGEERVESDYYTVRDVKTTGSYEFTLKNPEGRNLNFSEIRETIRNNGTSVLDFDITILEGGITSDRFYEIQNVSEPVYINVINGSETINITYLEVVDLNNTTLNITAIKKVNSNFSFLLLKIDTVSWNTITKNVVYPKYMKVQNGTKLVERKVELSSSFVQKISLNPGEERKIIREIKPKIVDTGDGWGYSIFTNPWFNTSFDKRINITFANAWASENITDFPVLVVLNSTRVNYSLTLDNGEDIRFTDDDESTILSHEIELWNESGDSFVWVKVPILENTDTDFIQMYYSNQSVVSDGQDIVNTWEVNFKMVLHLQETNSLLDSTDNNNDGSVVGDLSNDTGQIDGSIGVDGVNDYVDVSVSSLSTFTTSMWIFMTSIESNEYGGLMVQDNNNGIFYRGSAGGANANKISYYYDTDHFGNTAMSEDDWHNIVIVNNGGSVTFYLDGQNDGTSSSAPALSVEFIGSDNTDEAFGGSIDEVRISNSTRSDDWINASYISQIDTFNTYSAEETAPVEGGDSCTYTSGDWEIICSDECNITSNVVGDGSNLTLSGSGNFNVQANITNFQEVHKDNACFVIKSNDAQIELVN